VLVIFKIESQNYFPRMVSNCDPPDLPPE
jgi:hypothetical protein